MATTEIEQFPIPTAVVEHVLFGPADDRRLLQDSPILGDVWLAYAAKPGEAHDLLITPHKDATAAAVAREIKKRVRDTKGAGIAYLQGLVAARLTFEQLLHVLVPLTQWWRERGPMKQKAEVREALFSRDALPVLLRQIFSPEEFRRAQTSPMPSQQHFTGLQRYIALAGVLLWIGQQNRPSAATVAPPNEEALRRISSNIDGIVATLVKHWDEHTKEEEEDQQRKQGGKGQAEGQHPGTGLIFQVSLNRRVLTALERSVPAVKADAARRLFSVTCDKMVWAVVDSGIDREHDAFMALDHDTKQWTSRVRKTFDFSKIREIISSQNGDINERELDELLAHVDLGSDDLRTRRKEARHRLKSIAKDADEGRPVNWDTVEELITLAKPPRPTSPHGTHVAGIIGGDREGNGKTGDYAGGLCPDIRLYDFRVLGRTLEDTEFAVIAALQYIRYVNERHNYITIHGANLSLSIPHSVRNYACGHTPVCNECERLVDSGVVVVAAAGNRGYHKFETAEGPYEGYAAFSITDPGNGEGVITVGATHGNWPHTYGVSFFSSRGPTGDGRQKPDLVAPGERIQSTILDNDWGAESGTSMAAPHVSGAAAMLLARYSELIGQPRRVKRILCESATDLGRERNFQGHGILDVLRAFQSI